MRINKDEARKLNSLGHQARSIGDYANAATYFTNAAKIHGVRARRMPLCFNKVLAFQSATINYAMAENEAMADFYYEKYKRAHDTVIDAQVMQGAHQ